MAADLKGDPAKVADRLRGLCSRREYCRSDIMKKALASLEGNVDEASRVVDILIEEKFIDDLRYATAFARDKASISGWGEAKIRYMLLSKGIPSGTIDEALGEIDGGKASLRLQKLLENKARSLSDDPQKKLKLLRFALGRGYGYDEVRNVLDDLLNEK